MFEWAMSNSIKWYYSLTKNAYKKGSKSLLSCACYVVTFNRQLLFYSPSSSLFHTASHCIYHLICTGV